MSSSRHTPSQPQPSHPASSTSSTSQPRTLGTLQRHRPANTGSLTQTESVPAAAPQQPEPVLRLRGAHDPSQPHVRWAENVIDNEGLGRKSSKVCCIYHKPRGVDESSSEDDSSSDSSGEDSDAGPPSPREAARRRRRAEEEGHGHNHSHGGGKEKKKQRRPSPNAYEKQPRNRPKDEGAGS